MEANLAGETNANLVFNNASASADDANYWLFPTTPIAIELARVTVATALPTITQIVNTSPFLNHGARDWFIICHFDHLCG